MSKVEKVISDEAVEAALDALPYQTAEYHIDAMRAALEAAAPHILTQAFEDAAAHLEQPGQLWWGDGGVSVMEDEATLRRTKLTDWLRNRANPYRSQA